METRARLMLGARMLYRTAVAAGLENRERAAVEKKGRESPNEWQAPKELKEAAVAFSGWMS